MVTLPQHDDDDDDDDETTVWTQVRLALDELAAAVADTQHSPATRPALVQVVRDLEHAAGAPLGSTCSDPNVLLARRFARAHRLLLASEHPLDVARVRGHMLALQTTAVPAPLPRTPRSSAKVGV